MRAGLFDGAAAALLLDRVASISVSASRSAWLDGLELIVVVKRCRRLERWSEREIPRCVLRSKVAADV